MMDFSGRSNRPLSPEQQAICDQCAHPSGAFVEFPQEDVETSIPARFEKIVQIYPDRVAVKAADQVLTYRELNKTANRFAHAIHYQRGDGNEPIGILFEHDVLVTAAVLAVLKTGKICVVLDPGWPIDRLNSILEESGAGLVLTDTAHEHLVNGICGESRQYLNVETAPSFSDREPAIFVSPNASAYLIFTSGSTGKPKGVVLHHAAMLHQVRNYTNSLRLCAADRIAVLASASSAQAIKNINCALLVGAGLYFFDVKSAGLTRLAEQMIREEITVCHLSVSLFRYFVEAIPCGQSFPSLRILRLASQEVSENDFALYKKHFPPRCILVNGLSSTETGTFGWYFLNHQSKLRHHQVPVGYALEGYQILLLNDSGAEVGSDQVGEIAVKSRYLSVGYWAGQDLNRIKYSTDCKAIERIHLTGDLGRRDPDGCLFYVGRKDLRVKVRGYSVEISEVEKTLLRHPRIKDAAVRAWEHEFGEHILVGYVVPDRHPGPDSHELIAYLESSLPSYMIPSTFVNLEALPAANGKLNRAALPPPSSRRRSKLNPAIESPRNNTEHALQQEWQQLLRVSPIGVHDDFFELGGHSLLGARLISRLFDIFRVEVTLRDLFDHRTIARLGDLIAARPKMICTQSIPPLIPVPQVDALPLSFSQERLWFLDQLYPASATYNLCFGFQLDGHLDVLSLEQSFNEIIKRHAILRTVYRTENGQPSQSIQSSATIRLSVMDLRDLALSEVEMNNLYAREAQRPFDLSGGPLLRVALLRLDAEEWVLLLTIHHIVFDGWSLEIFLRELAAHYNYFASGNPPKLPELAVQYADFAVWQRTRWTERINAQLPFWEKSLEGLPERLNFVPDHRRAPSSTGGRRHFAFSIELSTALQRLCTERGVSPFILLLTAYSVLIYRYTGQSDIAVGSPVAGRRSPAVDDLIGFFLNTLVLRVNLSGNPTFLELLDVTRETCLAAYDHQDVPFEMVVQALQPERDLSYDPLVQATFALQRGAPVQMRWDRVSLKQINLDPGISRAALHLFIMDNESQWSGYLNYNRNLFKADTVARMVRHFEKLLEEIVAEPDRRLSALPMLAKAERDQLLAEWNDTQREYPKNHCLQELFEEQVERSPESVALMFEEQSVSYRELNKRANQVAHYLRRMGISANVPVAVCMERSIELVIALLGILKAGGVYVPLDPSCPKERLDFMLQDSGAQVLLTEQAFVNSFVHPAAEVIVLDTERGKVACESESNCAGGSSPDGLAYVIYTSGSTGQPKGVAVSHRAVIRLVKNTDYVQVTPADRVAQASNISFDAATFEIWGALLNGARLVLIANNTLLSPQAMAQAIERQEITTLFLTTLLFNQMAEQIPGALGKLQHLLFGGEAVDPEKVRRLLSAAPPRRLLHVYGPTETTTFATWYRVESVPADATTVPIGRPIANTEIYILDAQLNPVPIGVGGEIHIGGDGLARGYLNRPELTAEKFVKHPFSNNPQARLYKTGDRARFLPDGNIEFLGRIDDQVKIRGYRVEPGEIETILCQYSGLQECTVMAAEDDRGGKYLVAYVVAAHGGQLSSRELRAFLKEKLPEYMVPSIFEFLSSLPRMPNGKLDRRALPKPDLQRRGNPAGYVAPRTAVERVLAEIFTDVLRLERVGVYDNFFDLGGHSLMGMRLIAQVCKQFQIELPLRRLFEYPTIAGLADSLLSEAPSGGVGDRRGSSPWRFLIELNASEGKQPVFFMPGGIGGDYEFLVYARLTHFVGHDFAFYGLRARSTDGIELAHPDVEQMAADYLEEMQTLQPKGPYYIIGNCIGGIVAYEIAQRLKAQGQEIALLALMDTWCPTPQRYGRYRRNLLRARLKEHARRALAIWTNNYYVARFPYHWQQLRQMAWWRGLPYVLSKTTMAVKGSGRSWSSGWGATNNNPSVTARKRLQIQEGYIDTLRRYRPKPYFGPVVMLVNEKAYDGDPTLGWSKLMAGGIDTRKIPGDHEAYIRKYVKTAAEVLGDCLRYASVPNPSRQTGIEASESAAATEFVP